MKLLEEMNVETVQNKTLDHLTNDDLFEVLQNWRFVYL